MGLILAKAGNMMMEDKLPGESIIYHNFSPRDYYGYYHPPAALLVLNW